MIAAVIAAFDHVYKEINKLRHFLATFGTRTHSGGNDLPFNIFDNILGDTIASFMNDNDNNAKCNSEMIQAIAELVMGDGARVNVVCGSGEFTFVVHATQYCQEGNESGTCYAFSFNEN
uniref:Ground-like domain-containing protein n=1 Tax=Meloidogyne floridensis TaxID=298350 RepID=A0A915PGX0_9BILA